MGRSNVGKSSLINMLV
ncbi:MAG: GTPase [Chitinophagaceae bacterium]